MKMIEQSKIDLIISAILKARQHYPSICIKLDLTDENQLKNLGKDETIRTLDKLEKQEMILFRYDSRPFVSKGPIIGGRWDRDEKRKVKIFSPHHPTNNNPQIEIEDFSITVRLHDNFDNWLKTRQFFKKQGLKDLSPNSIKGLFNLTTLIKEKLETSHKPHLEFYSNEDQNDYLTYMKNKSIVSFYVHEFKNVSFKINVTLDVEKFLEFIPKIETVYKQTHKKINLKPLIDKLEKRAEATATSKPPTIIKKNFVDIQYRISFPPSNEILLNDLVVLSNPNLNSENGEIFGYLFEHPNKKITKDELERSINRKINKPFHKTLQNLGFTKELRKIFFTVSKTTIIFRNPITQSTFKEMGVSPLRFPAK